jgi:hypothetical protein
MKKLLISLMLAAALTFGCASSVPRNIPVELSPAAEYVLTQVNQDEKVIDIVKEENDGITMWIWIDSLIPEFQEKDCDHVAIIRLQPDGSPAEILHVFNAENVPTGDACQFATDEYKNYLESRNAQENLNKKKGGI